MYRPLTFRMGLTRLHTFAGLKHGLARWPPAFTPSWAGTKPIRCMCAVSDQSPGEPGRWWNGGQRQAQVGTITHHRMLSRRNTAASQDWRASVLLEQFARRMYRRILPCLIRVYLTKTCLNSHCGPQGPHPPSKFEQFAAAVVCGHAAVLF